MSDVVVSVVESNTAVTVTEQDVAVDVTENNVVVSVSTAGIQGVPGANNDPTYVTVRNATGATLAKGTIVYISGANGNNVQVSKAIATGDSTSARTIGWLAVDIPNNGSGLCMVEGYLEGLNTQGFTAGAQLYLSGTVAGGFTQTKPVAPIHLVYVGVVTKVSAGDGHVFVKVQNGYELGELHDVLIVSPTNNQVLAYDSATQLWKNATNAPDGVTSITATAPLTGGTITSTGSIGLDQTALSLTRSQISDFASGTVTSASTAQQAGTAVYATTSGTAVFATNASTAVNLSGSITKSQVSDFTSGTVASAGTAQQSGTAVFANTSGTATYATTSGTAVTISGDITKSQVSDFTSGTVASASTAQQSGTAVFANTSGTATFATTSGTATYADTSGTAVFATNASTAVTISGSITQSQVTNLTTDLANTAKLNTANTFSVGGHVINSSDVNAVPLAIRNATGQNGNSFEIRNNAGTPVLGIFQTGTVFFGPTQTTSGSFVSGISGRAFFNTTDAATSPLILRGATSQSADLLKIQNISATDLGYFTATGDLWVTGAVRSLFYTNKNNTGGYLNYSTDSPMFEQRIAGQVGLRVRGAASQSAHLLQLQDSSGTVLSGVSASGRIYTGTAPLTNAGAQAANISALADAATVTPLIVRGAASQSANLLELQNSAANILASFDSSGQLRTPAVLNPNSFNNSRIRVLDAGLIIDTGVASNVALAVTNTNATPTGDLFRANGTVGSFQITSSGGVRSAINVANSFGGGTSANNILAVRANVATNVPLIVSGAASQTANLQTWLDSSSNVLARVNASGIILGASLRTNTQYAQIKEENAGAALSLTKMTSQAGNDGADIGRIYFRDGTNAGTLKLVVRAGAAGAETTILDNIPQ